MAELQGRGRTFWRDPPARKVAGKLWLAAGLGDAAAVPAPSSLGSPLGAWFPFPRVPSTWAKLEEVPRTCAAGGDQPHASPRPAGPAEPSPPPPLPAASARARPHRAQLTPLRALGGRRRLHGAESQGHGRRRLYKGRWAGRSR